MNDMEKIKRDLEKALQASCIVWKPQALDKAAFYLQRIKEENQNLNLMGDLSMEEIINKHYLDSLLGFQALRAEKTVFDTSRDSPPEICDLGSGAGFPGMPLKLHHPVYLWVFLDSSRKKINFLKYLTRQMQLSGVSFINQRAEIAARNREVRESYDGVVARAVAAISVLSEWGLPLLKIGGKLILYKGEEVSQELKESQPAMKACGGEVSKVYEYQLLTGEKRKMVVLEKINTTPENYPRKPGRAKRQPL